MDEFTLTADEHVAETGRFIMSQQLDKILTYADGVSSDADVTAVHEMRKAIRRSFTCFKLFQPYFEPGILKPYRRGLRRIMRRLGICRDLAVFRLKLDVYNEQSERPLTELAVYWENRQSIADREVMNYLAKQKQQSLLVRYRTFTESPGLGVMKPMDPWAPVKTRYHLPILIYQRVAGVRAFDDKLEISTVKQLHRLRIQFKELRYTLQFFAPLLGEEVETALESLKQSQEHLGNLNDSTVALRFLDEMAVLERSVTRYRLYQAEEQERLVGSFLPVWQRFDQPDWRRDLAEMIGAL